MINNKWILWLMVVLFCGILSLVLMAGCISKPALINLPSINPAIPGQSVGAIVNLPVKEAMIDHLIQMFWFMSIISIMLTWILVLWLKRVAPWVKSMWLSIAVNVVILGIWELFVYLGWSQNHWKDIFVMSLCSWYAQAQLYDKLNLKEKLRVADKKS